MLTVAFIAFLLFQYVGDPVTNLMGQDATVEQRAQLRADLGLDQPFFVQFGHFIANAVQGEFGISLRQGRKVSSLIAERFPATLELAAVSALIGLLLGIPLGVYAALRRGTFLSQAVMTGSLLGVSLPNFLIGILLILVFAVMLKWLPSFGRGDVVALGPFTTGLLTVDGLKHLLLPAITGTSANCTAEMNSSPMPGHWNTVSVTMAKAMMPPSCSPAMVITGTSVLRSAWPK